MHLQISTLLLFATLAVGSALVAVGLLFCVSSESAKEEFLKQV
jgi:hypothetical protein